MPSLGRPSPLTHQQWEEIHQRLMAGDTYRGLAREYNVSDRAIRKRFPTEPALIRSIASQVIKAETMEQKAELFDKLKKVDASSLKSAWELLPVLQEITCNLANGARSGAQTFRHMSGVANEIAHDIYVDMDPETAGQRAKQVMVYTQIANEAAKSGLQLIASNKATVEKSLNEVNADEFAPVDALEASKIYQKLLNGT